MKMDAEHDARDGQDCGAGTRASSSTEGARQAREQGCSLFSRRWRRTLVLERKRNLWRARWERIVRFWCSGRAYPSAEDLRAVDLTSGGFTRSRGESSGDHTCTI